MNYCTLCRLLCSIPFILALFQRAASFSIKASIASTRREAIQSTFASTISLGMSNQKTTTTTSSAITKDTNKKKIKWGIIGLGDVCQIKSGPAFYKCEGSELVAVMRRTPGKAKEYAATKVPGGKCVGYDNIDEFLNHPDLDAVYVSTRPGTHLGICKKVAKAGKACYVEKPVGRCAQETQEIVKVFEHSHLKLYTAYISRAYDRTQKVRALLAEGVIGDKIVNVSYKLIGSGGARDITGPSLPWRLDPEQSGGGLIMDVGCHLLDRVDYFCGPLINVKGFAENKNSPNVPVEDYVHLTTELGESSWAALPSGKGAKIECTWDFSPKDADPMDELVICGPKGSLKMAGMSADGPVRVYNEKGVLQSEYTFDMPEHTAQGLIQAVTNDLLGKEKSSFLSYGDNAIRTQKVIDVALQSYYGGRESGFWARKT